MSFKNLVTKFLSLTILTFSLIVLALGSKASAATLEMSPSSANYRVGAACGISVDIMADATSQNSNAADMELRFNPAEITIIDSIPGQPNIQIANGDAYEGYVGNTVDTGTGIIRLTGFSVVSTLTSRKRFATVFFQPKTGVTSTSFSIKFDGAGSTLDSNVADSSTSLDLLTGVVNGSYTFTNVTTCVTPGGPATSTPNITFLTPKPFDINVPIDSNITFQITDSLAAIDLNSTEFKINSDIYKPTDPEVTQTGDPLNLKFVIKPRKLLLDSMQKNQVSVTTKNLTGNSANNSMIFYTPPICLDAIKPTIDAITSTENKTPVISGTGQPNANIVVTDTVKTLCSVKVDAAGKWSCLPSSPLPNDLTLLRAIQTDPSNPSVSNKVETVVFIKTSQSTPRDVIERIVEVPKEVLREIIKTGPETAEIFKTQTVQNGNTIIYQVSWFISLLSLLLLILAIFCYIFGYRFKLYTKNLERFIVEKDQDSYAVYPRIEKYVKVADINTGKIIDIVKLHGNYFFKVALNPGLYKFFWQDRDFVFKQWQNHIQIDSKFKVKDPFEYLVLDTTVDFEKNPLEIELKDEPPAITETFKIWGKKTYYFLKLILGKLLWGVFLAGFILSFAMYYSFQRNYDWKVLIAYFITGLVFILIEAISRYSRQRRIKLYFEDEEGKEKTKSAV